jgi:hypothetical protein
MRSGVAPDDEPGSVHPGGSAASDGLLSFQPCSLAVTTVLTCTCWRLAWTDHQGRDRPSLRAALMWRRPSNGTRCTCFATAPRQVHISVAHHPIGRAPASRGCRLFRLRKAARKTAHHSPPPRPRIDVADGIIDAMPRLERGWSMTPTIERSQYLMYPPFEGATTRRCASDLLVLLRRQVQLLELLVIRRVNINCKLAV